MQRWKPYRNTIVIGAVFIAIYLALIVARVANLGVWALFVIAWFAADWQFARHSPVTARQWVALTVALFALGWAVDWALG